MRSSMLLLALLILAPSAHALDPRYFQGQGIQNGSGLLKVGTSTPTADRACYFNGSSVLSAHSSVDSTELGFLNGVNSALLEADGSQALTARWDASSENVGFSPGSARMVHVQGSASSGRTVFEALGSASGSEFKVAQCFPANPTILNDIGEDFNTCNYTACFDITMTGCDTAECQSRCDAAFNGAPVGLVVKDSGLVKIGLGTFYTDGGVYFPGVIGTGLGFEGDVDGNASTATALAANPSDCSAGQFANAIAASGNLTCAQPGDVTGNAATATALAANPSDCSAGQFATTIAASGNLSCSTAVTPANSLVTNGIAYATGTGAIDTTAASKMRVDATNGRIAIGNTAPSVALDIYKTDGASGTSQLTITGSTSHAAMKFVNDNGQWQPFVAGTSGHFKFYDALSDKTPFTMNKGALTDALTLTSAGSTFAGVVTAPSGYNGFDRVANLTLTHGQILALNSTPIQIIAAPGAGFAINVIGIVCSADFVGTAYTSTGSLNIVPSGFTSLTQATCGTGIIEASADVEKVGGPASNITVKENTAYMVFVGTTNPTETGTADTVVKVWAIYRVVPYLL